MSLLLLNFEVRVNAVRLNLTDDEYEKLTAIVDRDFKIMLQTFRQAHTDISVSVYEA